MKPAGRYITSWLLLLFWSYAGAQSPQIDSLNRLIQAATSDTAKINLSLQKARQLNTVNLDSALQFAERTLAWANRIGYRKGQSGLLSFAASAYSIKGDYTAANQKLTLLSELLKTSTDSVEIGMLYGAYGDMYSIQERFDTSNLLLLKATGIIERNGYSPSLLVYYSDMGINYQSLANYAQALRYQQKTVGLAIREHRVGSEALAYSNMGVTYGEMGDTARSNQSYEQAMALAEANGLTRVAAYAYTNLCENAMSQQAWQKAYGYAMKSVTLAQTTGDKTAEAASLSKAAKSLAYLHRYEEAMGLAQRSVAIAEATGQSYVLAQAYSGISTLYMVQKKYAEAIPFLEKAVAAGKENEYNEFINTLYADLVTCYEATGNAAKALAAFKKYDENKDSTRSRENIQKATEMTMNFAFEKQQAIAKAEQDRKDAEAKRVRNQQLLLIVLLAIVVLAVVGIAFIQYRNNRQKQKANLDLQRQKQKVELTLAELKSAQAQLIQSEKMASLGELTAGIAHEIQNPLNFVNNFSELNNELIEEMSGETDTEEIKAIAADIKQNNEKIAFHGRRADAIVKGMLQHSRQSKGVKEATDMNALCDEYLRLSYHGLRAKDKAFNADFKTSFDERIGKIMIVPQDMGRVLLNLLNNAFYAVNEKRKTAGDTYKPLVSVVTKRVNDTVEIIVSDNGGGIPQTVIDKIFQPFFTTKPTGQGTGLGLSLSYDIITKEHGGNIRVESKEGESTVFIIQLPVTA